MPLHSQRLDIIAATTTDEPLLQQLKAVDKAVDALLEECLCQTPRRTQLADEEDIDTGAVLPIHKVARGNEIGDPLCDDYACDSDDDCSVGNVLVDAHQLDELGFQCKVISDLKLMIVSEPDILATSSHFIKPGQFFPAVAEVLAIRRTHY